MDVDPLTWTHRQDLSGSGRLPGPPHHGLGRGMKAGKEEIAGLIAGLRLFVRRDFTAERRRWEAIIAEVADALADLPVVEVELVPEKDSPRAYPLLRIELARPGSPFRATDVVNRLENVEPRICVGLSFIDQGALAIVPTEIDQAQLGRLTARLRAVLSGG